MKGKMIVYKNRLIDIPVRPETHQSKQIHRQFLLSSIALENVLGVHFSWGKEEVIESEPL